MKLHNVNPATTRKGKKVLEAREPQIHEDTKHVAIVKTTTTNDLTMKLMRDIHSIKKPFTVLMSKKNDIRPFESMNSLEFLCDKNECPLYLVSTHTKKRPNNLIFGRLYDGHLLDQYEFGVDNVFLMDKFKNEKVSFGCKPIINFAGDAWDTQFEYIRLKNYFTDFFVGPKVVGIRLAGIESMISLVAVEGKIHFRHYRLILKKSGTKVPRVELDEIGPRFDMTMRRNNLPSDDLFKRSLKQPYMLNPTKKKNISQNPLGTTHGRIHMERQDYTKLSTRKMKGLKKGFGTDSNNIPVAKRMKADHDQEEGGGDMVYE